MTYVNNIYNILPPSLFAILKTVRRLQYHYRENFSAAACFRGGHALAVAPVSNAIIDLPDLHRYAEVFKWMTFDPTIRRETKCFLRLCKGCSSLLDVGASAGYYSALFAKTRYMKGRILSVEADSLVFEILKQTCDRNCTPDIDWSILNKGVFARPSKLPFLPFESGYEARIVDPRGVTDPSLLRFVECDTVEGICTSHSFEPDVIKIDIESFEYELVMSTESYLRRHKPRLQLEVHLHQMKERGIDHTEMMTLLIDIGYQDYIERRDLKRLSAFAGKDGLVRLSLACA